MPMLMSAPEWRALSYLRSSHGDESLAAVSGAMSVAPEEGRMILDHLVYRGLVDDVGGGRIRLSESGEAMLGD